jgi:hypothetical protein
MAALLFFSLRASRKPTKSSAVDQSHRKRNLLVPHLSNDTSASRYTLIFQARAMTGSVFVPWTTLLHSYTIEHEAFGLLER